MRMLTSYMPPSSGSATIDGHDVVIDSLAAHRQIGYLPEGLCPEMTVAGYLDHMARATTPLTPQAPTSMIQ